MSELTPEMPALSWDETWDDDDNTTYEAPSPYCTEDGDAFYWRVSPRLIGNVAVWNFRNSDEEALPDSDEAEADYPTADAAKAVCERWNREIIADAEANGGFRDPSGEEGGSDE